MVTSTGSDSSGHKGSGRGFASLDDERKRQIASKGGQSVPPEKRSFSRDHRLAAEAGRKGGENVRGEVRSFSRDRALAAEAGRKGGTASRGSRHAAAQKPDSGADEGQDIAGEESPPATHES
jgi:general stress protein YciG